MTGKPQEQIAISEHTDQESDPSTRRPSMGLAIIAGILAPGLGYLYVGRLQLALMTLPAMILIVAIAGWTRLIIEPAGFYVTYLSIITIWLISVVHPAIVANGSGQLATKAYNRGWFYVAWLLVVTVIAIGYPGLRAPLFGFEPFRIPANSMAPTILRNDYVMADTWHFEQSEPGINDLIVYEMPDNPDIHYMKRIVGLPGDTIEIQNDVLIRNGQSVSEGFVQLSGAPAGRISNFGPVEVPEDHYFVLGDNRHNSMDSRFTGPIHKDYLHGRIIYRWFAYDGGISWKRFPARLAVE